MQLSDREVEAHQALLQYPRDEVPPQLELAVDRITKLDPTTAYLAKWILLPYAEIGKEKALPRSLRLHRSRWEPEIESAIENPIAKAAGITAYVANDSQFLRRPGDGLRVFCVGDNPRHCFAPRASQTLQWAQIGAERTFTVEAMLEFRIEPLDESNCTLHQTALFQPKGLFGLLYWWSVVPLHNIVFSGMLQGIRREALKGSTSPEPARTPISRP